MLNRLVLAALVLCSVSEGARFASVAVRTADQPDSVESNAARILKERLAETTGLSVRIEREREAAKAPSGALLILLGTARSHRGIARFMEREKPLADPEGFVLKTFARPEEPVLVAAGVDSHGVLYAVGEILRRADVRPDGLEFPVPLEIRTAPAFEIRGTQYGQSRVALEKGKVRPWTPRDARRKIEDYALAGLNTVEFSLNRRDDGMYQFIRSMGLKTLVSEGPNIGAGPPEWKAWEAFGRPGYLCPSHPQARQELLQRFEERYREAAPMDYIRFKGGDGGGCECDRCKPYGRVFMLLCEDMAKIIHRYHPRAQIFVANQKFDNESDQAIFAYLQEKPRPWVRAFCYGPGSDGMVWQPGYRQNYRMDLFRYPGFGPFDRYLKEILHQLPPQQDIVFFNELTHTRGSQYGYISSYPRADRNGDLPPHWNHDIIYDRRIEPALAMVFDRLTFFAWPRYYHWVFNQTLRYGIGDVTHSSGTQDQFNQWMWQRLMWSPQRGVEDVVAEYARAWFGPEAAPSMAQAIFQLEQNFQANPDVPLARKDGIDTYLRLVREAGERMPAGRMKDNWLWREYMQKALLDKHVQLNVRRQTALKERIERRVAAAMRQDGIDAAIGEALSWLEADGETEPMRQLRQEALRLGEESNRLFGVRSDALFNLDHDFVGLGWMKRQLERARAASGEQKTDLLGMIADYENPGEGGFYDDAGSFQKAPHIVRGQPYTLATFSEANRPSQRTLHFTQDQEQGVTLRYEGLDPAAAYRIRFTFVRPRYLERFHGWMHQKSQTIFADEFVLAKELEIPEYMSDFFSFDIPPQATRDGELVVRLEKAAALKWGSRVEREVWRNTDGWGTIVSEVWLMKKKR